MAYTSGQQYIRGIDIDKLAKGFADEEFIFKRFLTVTPTSAREIRWYQKTAGVLDSTDTSGVTTSQIANTAELAMPVVVEQSWTRRTSYVRKYFAESPWISFEDINDSDPDILATNVRDITRAVANQVDKRIYSQMSGSFALSGNAGGTGWGDATNGNPILDLLSGSALIRGQGYDISNLTVIMNQAEYKKLLNFIISTKGSSIPSFASDKVGTGVLTKLMNNNIIVSANADASTIIQFVPQRAATWKTFTPITAITKDEPGIGTKIRVWEEGEILVTDINAGCTIKGC